MVAYGRSRALGAFIRDRALDWCLGGARDGVPGQRCVEAPAELRTGG